jgi:hypothetical protein
VLVCGFVDAGHLVFKSVIALKSVQRIEVRGFSLFFERLVLGCASASARVFTMLNPVSPLSGGKALRALAVSLNRLDLLVLVKVRWIFAWNFRKKKI